MMIPLLFNLLASASGRGSPRVVGTQACSGCTLPGVDAAENSRCPDASQHVKSYEVRSMRYRSGAAGAAAARAWPKREHGCHVRWTYDPSMRDIPGRTAVASRPTISARDHGTAPTLPASKPGERNRGQAVRVARLSGILHPMRRDAGNEKPLRARVPGVVHAPPVSRRPYGSPGVPRPSHPGRCPCPPAWPAQFLAGASTKTSGARRRRAGPPIRHAELAAAESPAGAP